MTKEFAKLCLRKIPANSIGILHATLYVSKVIFMSRGNYSTPMQLIRILLAKELSHRNKGRVSTQRVVAAIDAEESNIKLTANCAPRRMSSAALPVDTVILLVFVTHVLFLM
ncbi:hypothetical protein FGIG_06663 [Fasciola gigantica]|uniref:Uncharacterized protein n=1 Tax=Fasciola gigantica TaxID=46835 RepID=A0A504Y8G7_FASGI|nr:hypothetical protein FGIG_06663 [Fasciola gigantica]